VSAEPRPRGLAAARELDERLVGPGDAADHRPLLLRGEDLEEGPQRVGGDVSPGQLDAGLRLHEPGVGDGDPLATLPADLDLLREATVDVHVAVRGAHADALGHRDLDRRVARQQRAGALLAAHRGLASVLGRAHARVAREGAGDHVAASQGAAAGRQIGRCAEERDGDEGREERQGDAAG
jgi:hypothetical protein